MIDTALLIGWVLGGSVLCWLTIGVIESKTHPTLRRWWERLVPPDAGDIEDRRRAECRAEYHSRRLASIRRYDEEQRSGNDRRES